jgi:hypothetical protein
MTCQLPADCLNEIFEFLEEDRYSLHSCLLVNRLWCQMSVRILWRNIWNFKILYQRLPLNVASSILSTLIACLPNESKELLHKNEVYIQTPTSNSPLFNYATYCKVLSINIINGIVSNVLKNETSSKRLLITKEIIKMFINQISSLRRLNYYSSIDFSFTYFPGARDLSEFCCCSDLPTYFFHQLSQICHNLQSISISFCNDVSNELKELISIQKNLKNLTLSDFDGNTWKNIIPVLTKHSHTLTKLRLYSDNDNLPYSFISLCTNLQEIIFSFLGGAYIEDFKMLQYIKFSKLQTLKIPYQCPRPEHTMKFLENNGKNLTKFYTDEGDKALSLSISNFCPNLKSLFVIFNSDESDILKTILLIVNI